MIRLRTLGALDLCGADGLELRGVLAQPKRAALLVYLVLAAPRGPRRRDTLLALFWPELDAERARNALSQAVHFLRRSLGADVLVNNNGDELTLDWSTVWCDAVAFEDALDAGRVADALELYRGDLLDGVHVANAPEFERWLDAERSRLGARYARAVEVAAAERERAGDLAGSIAYWRRLAARDPYSSRTALGLMRAMAAAGDAAGAVRHARVHETLLREELALAPDAEVTALVRDLQAPAPESGGVSTGAQAAVSTGPTRSTVHGPTVESTTAPAPDARRADVPHADVASTAVAYTDTRRDRPGREPAAIPREGVLRRNRRRIVSTSRVVALVAVAAVAIVVAREALTASPPIRSLLVLPFANLSGSAADQVLVDGMHAALISELGRYKDLHVISRTSAIQFKGTDKRLPEIARAVDVDAVVEGTLLHEGARVRVDAQLRHGESDRNLWGETYRRDLQDIMALQSELAAAIAREIHLATTPPVRTRRTTTGPPDAVPEELYLRELYARGRHAEVNRSAIGMQTATLHYRSALARDSGFALAYAGLAENYALQAHYNYMPKGVALDSARMMAQRAVALDNTLPEAHVALALALGNAGQFGLAEREFQKAIDLGPSNAAARYWYGMLLVALGRGSEALEQADLAMRLDPLAPRAALSTKRYAEYLTTGTRRQFDLPVRERRPILKTQPGEPWARARDAAEFAEEGSCTEARSELLRAQQLDPDSTNMVLHEFVGRVYWACGERPRARALLAQMKRHPEAHAHGMRIANLHARFGEPDSAIEWLGRHRWTISELAMLSGDAGLDPLRSDPRFVELLARIGVRERPASVAAPSSR